MINPWPYHSFQNFILIQAIPASAGRGVKKEPPDRMVRRLFSDSGLIFKPLFVQVQPRTVV
ncbi:hypothetical protein ACS33_02070 [Edwardsiella ictaluri]|nr:hypothetical protein ACS33_02070 [Edwardsiella ictaluri]